MTKRITPREAVAMIAEASGIGFTTKRLFGFLQAGNFPKPVTRLNRKTVFFDRSQIAEWIKEHFPNNEGLET